MADASVVMDLMMATHNKDEKLSEDDPQTSYLILSSWARMCKVMGMCYLINCVLITNKEQFNR